jgi:hypothetical protein
MHSLENENLRLNEELRQSQHLQKIAEETLKKQQDELK